MRVATPTVANPYHYADNDPLNKVDPLGLRPKEPLTCEQFFAIESYIYGSKLAAGNNCNNPDAEREPTSPIHNTKYEQIHCAVVVGPGDCQKAQLLALKAVDDAIKEYPNSSGNGRNDRNAFQHAYWNTLMVIEIGWGAAVTVATNHEIYNLANTPREYTMDMRNNAVGRRIGTLLVPRYVTAFDEMAQTEARFLAKLAEMTNQLCVLDPLPARGPCY